MGRRTETPPEMQCGRRASSLFQGVHLILGERAQKGTHEDALWSFPLPPPSRHKFAERRRMALSLCNVQTRLPRGGGGSYGRVGTRSLEFMLRSLTFSFCPPSSTSAPVSQPCAVRRFLEAQNTILMLVGNQKDPGHAHHTNFVSYDDNVGG
jgi:hypothetical protein